LRRISKISLSASCQPFVSRDAPMFGLQYTEVRLLFVELCTAYTSLRVPGSGFGYPHLTLTIAFAVLTPI